MNWDLSRNILEKKNVNLSVQLRIAVNVERMQ